MTAPGYPDRFGPDMPLGEARGLLREIAQRDGGTCPCCGQMARVYRRKLTSVPAMALAALFADHGLEYGHLPTVAEKHLSGQAHQGGYLTLGAHWDLMVDERHRRPDGGRAGMWRVTTIGERWLRSESTVPMYAHLYDGQRLGFSGDPVAIEDVIGAGFNLHELLAASTEVPTDDKGVPALFREAA